MALLQSEFRICIIGAGIVGLAGGILLSRHGFQVTIVEKDPGLQTVGAGIQLHPNALRVLQDLGVYDDVKAESVLTPTIMFKDYATGRTLHAQDVRGAEERYGAPVLTVHRAHLRQALYDQALAAGVHFEFGIVAQAGGVDLAGGAITLHAADGGPSKVVSADLFVGADGGTSAVREAFTGRKLSLVPHGKVVHRIVLDEALIRARPNLRHLVDAPNIIVWAGPASMAVTYSLAGRFNIAFTRPGSLDPADAFFRPEPVDLDGFLAELAVEGWDPEVLELIGLASDCMRWMFFEPLIDNETVPWVDAGARFCIVGDAAHQTLPYLAQGAAMGLESISVLAQLLSKAHSREQVRDCLDVYQRLRKERTGHVNRAGLKNGAIWQMPDGPLRDERNRVLLNETPSVGFPNPLADPFFQVWLWGFDAPTAANEAWELHMRRSSR
ncbi:FAD/NAD(P)-binding domain-containing protein [Cryphonectria parasitica EP155]|uniref:FAD/NAD(P)-binding domain-containing protein n=1 Tax=Cryphonectria parasitica (strain ATCC 38755 / EP155) TaxID=660469 RepID=A0A9P4Y524_CRYP1|nr:FAD/NAD(P)-binding domain-containing protein [Cryphonectria parasitica EP155]KAF3766661.1 FAD/NAD(P)-binding domain-containing protein [Cryphonectria parasitica EP155]